MIDLPFSETSPLPAPVAEDLPYWDGLARGALVLKHCGVCGATNHPIARRCGRCESPGLEWREFGAEVELFSWVVEARPVIPGMKTPYVVAQVTLPGHADGEVRLVGTIIADPSALRIGMPLTLEPSKIPGADRSLAVYRAVRGGFE